tara:strand:+ start:324 stop:902 length:579 start_codon:yes stop_codon:yes gene_type:complete
MAKSIYTVFPDFVFTGDITLTPEIEEGIKLDLESLDKGVKHNTTFGYTTLKEVPLTGNLRKLQLLVGSYFIDAIKDKHKTALDRQVEVVEPTIVGVKPGHSLPVMQERNRWYNGCVWLQTTNKGSSLYMENFTSKRYSDPPGIQDYTNFEKSKQWKYVFWPAHIPAGFTPNTSMIDTEIFYCTFTAFPNPKK